MATVRPAGLNQSRSRLSGVRRVRAPRGIHDDGDCPSGAVVQMRQQVCAGAPAQVQVDDGEVKIYRCKRPLASSLVAAETTTAPVR